MANDDELGSEERLERSAVRTVLNWFVVLASIGVLGAWGATNEAILRLEPGEAAVILRVGKFNRIISTPGLKFLLPAPIEYPHVVNVREVRHLEFGVGESPDEAVAPEGQGGIAIQTSDSNIVMLNYELQYRIHNPFSFLFGVAEAEQTLVDATQAAVREVVGRKTINEVLEVDRRGIEEEAAEILQTTLDDYFAEKGMEPAFAISRVELQNVQPPIQVAQAFADVVSAQQDEERSLSVAAGDALEIRSSASAKAREYREIAQAYKQSRILEASGEAARFEALMAEYHRAPEVTRRRLYLETMETVMPGVEKMVVEPDTVHMMPFLQAPGSGRASTSPLSPVNTAAPAQTGAQGSKAGGGTQ